MTGLFIPSVHWVHRVSWLTLLILLPFQKLQGETNRPGEVQFSNGESAEGTLSLSPGSELKIYVGSTLKTLPLDRVREVLLEPVKETMDQKWRFEEAGRTQKKYWGQPYPVRELRATITLVDGPVFHGHLFTTVLYLAGPEQTTKIVLRAKDKGQEGQTFNDLVYPTRLAFTDQTQPVAGKLSVTFLHTNATELVALTPGALLRVAASRTPGANEFHLAGLQTDTPFMAYKTDASLQVVWSSCTDTGLTARMSQALGDARDFFDSKQLLGIQRAGDNVYTLLMLARLAHTTLEQDASQPWRLEIWRWKDNGDRLMVAGRGYFYRGITRKSEGPPRVELIPDIKVEGSLP